MNPERIRILDLLGDAGIEVLPACEFGGPVGQWVAVQVVGRSYVTIAGPDSNHDRVEQAALAFLGQK
jgi:hypothetical protein